MTLLRRRNRFYDTARFGQPEIRVYHRRGMAKKTPRYLLKCGCCKERLEIHYAADGLEIGGVNGAIADWREILLPLLGISDPTACGRRRISDERCAVAFPASGGIDLDPRARIKINRWRKRR
jgi:hypothetical protein